MNPDTFLRSTHDSTPPEDLSPALLGLWWAKKDEWEKAHATVQADATKAAAWVHAYLHRVEGDLGNARYWYKQAGKTPAQDSLQDEWRAITQTLLADDASA